ncbi:hypothetical protein ACE1AT_05535 [Pelatocladus sp. BLCC-F211]|uniref:hypothetical protein n=1 Tax=Pelatocladus sp. BLCC-F211 TaxID=3342752 RepID=UPI0035B8F808
MTFTGWVVGGITSIALEKYLLQTLPPAVLQQQPSWYGLVKIMSSVVFAIIFAADQALVLRRYLSAWWLWVLVTSVGWLVANHVSTAWINYISSIADSLNKTLSFEDVIFFGGLSTLSYVLSGIWVGFLQWLVLRQYTAGAWWWNFLPSFSYLCISIFVWLLSCLQDLIPEVSRAQILYLSGQALTAIILGVIPAIGFCRLKIYSQRILASK